MQEMFTMCSVILDSAEIFFRGGRRKLETLGELSPKGAWIKPWLNGKRV